MLFNQKYDITLLIRHMEYVLFCVGWVGWLVGWFKWNTYKKGRLELGEWFKRASAFKLKTCHNSLSYGLTNNMKKNESNTISFKNDTISVDTRIQFQL